MLRQYSRVKLISPRFQAEGASPGMLGYVIEVHPDGRYEVEFSGENGATLAQVVLSDADLEPAPEPPVSPE